jgi:hypothetical protein
MGGAPDTHDFRLEGGKIRYVHAITVMSVGGSSGRGAKLGGAPKGAGGAPKGARGSPKGA